jgi:hypothetical protein
MAQNAKQKRTSDSEIDAEFRLHWPEKQAHDPNSRYARSVRACAWIPQFSRAERILCSVA